MNLQDLRDASAIKIEKAKIECIKKQMDAKLMTLEAIEAAKACYSSRSISEMRMQSYGPNDQGAEVMQSLVQQYHNAKRATGN